MVKGKVAGVVFGGLAGYLLIVKGLNVLHACVKDICTAAEWKAYYKDKEGLHVAPGYQQYTRKINDDEELVVEKADSRVRKAGNEDASLNDLKASLSSAISKSIDAWLNGRKGQEEASEGETEASEEPDISGEDTDGDEVLAEEGDDKDETVD